MFCTKTVRVLHHPADKERPGGQERSRGQERPRGQEFFKGQKLGGDQVHVRG